MGEGAVKQQFDPLAWLVMRLAETESHAAHWRERALAAEEKLKGGQAIQPENP